MTTKLDKTYLLMIKTHRVTGIRYLCVTSKERLETYKGSGTRWLHHLKKHGAHIDTEVLYVTNNLDDLAAQASIYSRMLDVVADDSWANIIEETGYDNGSIPAEYYWANLTPEAKTRRIEVHRQKLIALWEGRSEEARQEQIKACHKGRDKRLETLSYEDHIALTDNARQKAIEWFETMTKGELEEYRQKLSASQKLRWSKISEDERSSFGRKVSSGRLNMSIEAKNCRREKLRQKFSADIDGKYKANFDKMARTRLGGGNPAAVPISVDGRLYSSIREAASGEGIDENRFRNQHRRLKRTCYTKSDFEPEIPPTAKPKTSRQLGSKNPQAKQIIVDSIVFPTVKSVHEKFGLSLNLLYNYFKLNPKDNYTFEELRGLTPVARMKNRKRIDLNDE